MSSVPRRRTLPKIHATLLRDDPETDVTMTALRRWAKHGDIEGISVGTHTLYDYDAVLAFLAGQTSPAAAMEVSATGVIRRVEL